MINFGCHTISIGLSMFTFCHCNSDTVSQSQQRKKHTGLQEFLNNGSVSPTSKPNRMKVMKLLSPELWSIWNLINCLTLCVIFWWRYENRMGMSIPERLCMRLCCPCNTTWQWMAGNWSFLIILSWWSYGIYWTTEWSCQRLVLCAIDCRLKVFLLTKKITCGTQDCWEKMLQRNLWTLSCILLVSTSHCVLSMSTRTYIWVDCHSSRSKLIPKLTNSTCCILSTHLKFIKEDWKTYTRNPKL